MNIRRPVVVLALAAAALVLPRPASALSWILALPPAKGTVAVGSDPRKAVAEALDRDAPITSWARGIEFATGSACEEARLQAIKDFGGAAEALAGRAPSSAERANLATLGRRAFGRCVPAFAFEDSGPARGDATSRAEPPR